MTTPKLQTIIENFPYQEFLPIAQRHAEDVGLVLQHETVGDLESFRISLQCLVDSLNGLRPENTNKYASVYKNTVRPIEEQFVKGMEKWFSLGGKAGLPSNKEGRAIWSFYDCTATEEGVVFNALKKPRKVDYELGNSNASPLISLDKVGIYLPEYD